MKWNDRTCLSFETHLSAAVEFDLPGLNGLSMKRLTTHTPMTADYAIEVYIEATREPVLGNFRYNKFWEMNLHSTATCRNCMYMQWFTVKHTLFWTSLFWNVPVIKWFTATTVNSTMKYVLINFIYSIMINIKGLVCGKKFANNLEKNFCTQMKVDCTGITQSLNALIIWIYFIESQWKFWWIDSFNNVYDKIYRWIVCHRNT